MQTQTVQEKLDRGLELLQNAGHDPNILGTALQSIHGALEDHVRTLLSKNSAIPIAQRSRIGDRGAVKWKELLDLMQHYENLSESDRRWILSMNTLRNNFAHGGSFHGNRHQIEQYAGYVQNQLNLSNQHTQSSPQTTNSQVEAATLFPAFECRVWRNRVSVSATLDHFTGTVVDLKERTEITKTEDSEVKKFIQKVWLRTQDGGETHVELVDFNLPLRRNHTLTLVYGSFRKQQYCVAATIYEMRQHFYNQSTWLSLLVTQVLRAWVLMGMLSGFVLLGILTILGFSNSPIMFMVLVLAGFFYLRVLFKVIRHLHQVFAEHIAVCLNRLY
jgi:hypothetical protein